MQGELSITNCGKDDCTPIEHWQRLALHYKFRLDLKGELIDLDGYEKGYAHGWRDGRAETPEPGEAVWFHAAHGLHDEAHHQHHRPLDICVPLTMGHKKDPRVDWDAVEQLVDAAIRHEAITQARGAEILGISIRTWRERAKEIHDEGNPLYPLVPTDRPEPIDEERLNDE